MTTCIRKTTSPVVCVPLAMVILLSVSAFAMGAGAGAGGGGAADGHVGGPGISDLTRGTGGQGAVPGIVGGRPEPGPGAVRRGSHRSRSAPARRQPH
jgi:hypothetical protein